jgi:acyl-coenzyme A synthetase/AMP-(fatty) acid ligase
MASGKGRPVGDEPLINGATSVMYEGGPAYPDKDRFWSG